MPGIAITLPKPMHEVNRSRTVMARCAGTVSSSCEAIDRRTRRLASSGNQGSIESSSRSLHSSTRIIAATAVTGLVNEASRNSVSRCMGADWPIDSVSIVSKCTSSWQLTRATSPGISPRSTWPDNT